MTDFSVVGGRSTVLMGADPNDPANVIWNFGVIPKTPEVAQLITSKPTLHQRFPNLAGRWDGRTTINHWEAIRKVLGDEAEDLIQYQPRGTCGGRAGSFGLDAVQCVLIASGKQKAKFNRASHAWLYWQARKKYGMDNGNPNNENQDGVIGGSIPEILTTKGACNRPETNDLNAYGAGSDDLACKWGAGQISSTLAAELEKLASDNIITEWAPVASADELADGIASGGIGIGSDMQGFTMTRDNRGFCSPQGQWAHYQVRVSVGVFNGVKGFGYNQSWGKTTPNGPLLPGHPGNCFGVEFNLQDRIIKSGDWAVVFGFPLWELESGSFDIPWIF